MELSDEQRAHAEANKERAKQRRLERYLEQLEAGVEEESPAGERQGSSEHLGGGFIPPEVEDGDEEAVVALAEQAEILFPLELNDKCVVCGSLDLDEFIRRNYRAMVCAGCREAHPDRFGLVTKTAARDEFLLTDEELRDAARMPHVSRPNPLRPTWSSMQLFLREHVRAFALEKWGSLEAIEEAAQRRTDAHHALKVKRFAANLRELRSKTKLQRTGSAARPSTYNHRHTFAESRDAASSTVASRCTECGFTVVSEEL